MKKQSDNQQEVIASGEHIDNVVNFEVKNAKDFEGLTQLYKKIFNYLLYKNKEVIPSENYELNQFKIEK